MSKKRGKSNKIIINFSNRWLYTLILIGSLIAVGTGIWAATYSASGAGHSYTEISTCAANQILKMSSDGSTWTCGTESGGSSWQVPTDVKCTTAKHNGDFKNIGDAGTNGYRGMYNWIQTNGCAGYHVCDTTEIARWRQMNGTTPNCEAWYTSTLLYTYSSSIVSECYDWTMSLNSNSGPYFSAMNNGRAFTSTCDVNYAVLCCK